MAFPATTQLYQREAGLQNARAQQEYDRYISDLARQYGIAEGNLNANMEGRGILRSGEASTARTRLSAENQSLRSAALQDLEYQKNMNEINLLKQLASLQANQNQQATVKSPRFDTDVKSPDSKSKPFFPTYRTPQYATARTGVTTSGMGSGRTTSTVRPVTMTADQMERRVSYAGR